MRTGVEQIAGHDWEVTRHGGAYYAICSDLNLNAAGDSLPELRRCAEDAVRLLEEETSRPPDH